MNHLTPRQEQTLSIISRRQPISRAELSQLLGCRPQTTSQFLMYLRRCGLIEPVGKNNRHDSQWALAQIHRDQPPEITQAASVWEYARRCAQEMRA